MIDSSINCFLKTTTPTEAERTATRSIGCSKLTKRVVVNGTASAITRYMERHFRGINVFVSDRLFTVLFMNTAVARVVL